MIANAALAFTALSLIAAAAPVRAENLSTPAKETGDGAQSLQGTWTGVGDYGDKDSAGRVTVTFTGHSLHFQGAKTNDWYDAAFTLPTGTSPKQLHSVISASPDTSSIRKRVFAIFKLEAELLTLAEVEASAIETPKNTGMDKPLYNVQDGTLGLLRPNASDGWKALEPSIRFRARLRKIGSHMGAATTN